MIFRSEYLSKLLRRPSDRDINWMSPVQGKSPLVQVKEPYGNLDMVTEFSGVFLRQLLVCMHTFSCWGF